jgi:endonuclease/exonuclease/phosphatase family metal-dependent hydrolase
LQDRTVLRLFRTIIIVVALAIVLICAAYEIGPERWWPLAFLQYVPYYIFLAPALIAFAISFKLSIRWRLVAGIALALVLTILMDLAIGLGDTGTQSIRVMTYNVKDYISLDSPEGLATISDEVARHDPDVLVFQDAGRLNAKRETTPSAMASLYGNRQVYTFGQYAVASRYPLRDCKPGKISYRERQHTYVHCIVSTGFTQIDLYTAHFLTPRDGLNAVRHERFSGIDEWEQNVADRMTQAEALANAIKSSIRPVILAGDFNAPDSSLVVRTLLSADIRDAFSSAGKGYGYTYGHSLRPGISFLRIDHIFVSPSIGVADCYVGGKLASPHRPVIADLLLNRQSK